MKKSFAIVLPVFMLKTSTFQIRTSRQMKIAATRCRGKPDSLYTEEDRQELFSSIANYRSSNQKSFCFIATKTSSSEPKSTPETLKRANKIEVEYDRGYLGSMYRAESTVARRLKNMAASEYAEFADAEDVRDGICTVK